MEKLIEALQIFLKYGNPAYPTHCEHDTLYICGIEWDEISKNDQEALKSLGFLFSESDDSIISYRFGSA